MDFDVKKKVCGNCGESFTDPRLMPCLHTFCLACIEDMAKEPVFACVLCRQPVMSTTAATQLPVNYAFIDVSVSDGPKCVDCGDETKAASRCTECDVHLCEDHARLHKRKKQHDLVLLAPVLHPCKVHINETVCAFCEDCNELVCLVCCVNAHYRHGFKPIDNSAERKAERLSESVVQLEQRRQRLDEAVTQLSSLHVGLTAAGKQLTQEINSAFNGVIERLQARRDELVAHSQEECEALVKTAQLQQDELEIQQSRIAAACVLANAMVDSVHTHPHQLLQLAGTVLERIDGIANMEPVLECLVQSSLRFHFVNPFDGLELGTLSRRGDWRRRDLTTISRPALVFATFCGDVPQNMRPAFMTETSSGLIACTDSHNHCIHLLNARGAHFRTIGRFGDAPGQFNHVQGIAATDDGHMWVCDYSNSRLQCFREDGSLVRTLACPMPVNVAVLPDGDLVVAQSYGVRRLSPSQNGATVWSIAGESHGDTPGLFNGAFGIAVTMNGTVVVSDHSNNRFQLLSSIDGHVERIITGLIRPVALCVTLDDLLLFTERHEAQTERVSVMSLDGTRVHQWGAPGTAPGQFTAVNGLCLLHNGRVAVSDVARIQIF